MKSENVKSEFTFSVNQYRMACAAQADWTPQEEQEPVTHHGGDMHEDKKEALHLIQECIAKQNNQVN